MSRIIVVELRVRLMTDHGTEIGRLTNIGARSYEEVCASLRAKLDEYEQRAEEASELHRLLAPKRWKLPRRR